MRGTDLEIQTDVVSDVEHGVSAVDPIPGNAGDGNVAVARLSNDTYGLQVSRYGCGVEHVRMCREQMVVLRAAVDDVITGDPEVMEGNDGLVVMISSDDSADKAIDSDIKFASVYDDEVEMTVADEDGDITETIFSQEAIATFASIATNMAENARALKEGK